MLVKVVEPVKIEYFLTTELVRLSSMVNVDQRLNLQKHQVPEIAKALMEEFPTENLADFKICFKRGAMGKYDDLLLRLDMAVIVRWMGLYLEEKYAVIEKQLYETPDNMYKPIEMASLEALQKDWLEEWKKDVGYKEKSRDNAQENEFQRFKLSDYQTKEQDAIKRQRHLEYIRENYEAISGKPKACWTEEKEWLQLKYNL